MSEWFGGVVAVKMAQGWSHTRIADEAGLSRKDFYRYLDPTQAPKSPRAATVRRICKGLKVDYAEAVEELGWGKTSPKTLNEGELVEYIRRAKALAAEEGTSERRRQELEQSIRNAELARQAAASNRLTAQQMARNAEEMERTAEALIREALGENEDAPER